MSTTGNFALTFRVVENQAPGSPAERVAQASHNASGEFVALGALFAPGEVLEFVGVDFGQGPVDPATLPELSFTVLPLDDPATECTALSGG